MNRISVFLACLFVAGCSLPRGPDSYSAPSDTSEFKLISEKLVGEKCLAGFERDGLLFFVMKKNAGGSYTLSVYDSRTGFLSSHTIPSSSGYRTCSHVRLSYTTKIFSGELRYASGTAIRKPLDQYHMQPESFWHAVSDWAASHASWYETEQTMYINELPRPARTIADVVSILRNLRKYNQAAALVKSELDRRQRRDDLWAQGRAAERAAREAYVLAEQQGKARWEQRMSYQLKIGDRVCTYSTNFVGDVETLVSNRVKVYVYGRAVAKERPGILFSGAITQKVELEKIESPRWFNRDELAKCPLEERA